MAGSYPNSGALFKNTRAADNPRAPQFEGDIEFDADLLRALVAKAKAGEAIKVRLAGWTKPTRNGGEFVSLKASLPQPRREEAPRQQRAVEPAVIDDDIPF